MNDVAIPSNTHEDVYVFHLCWYVNFKLKLKENVLCKTKLCTEKAMTEGQVKAPGTSRTRACVSLFV